MLALTRLAARVERIQRFAGIVHGVDARSDHKPQRTGTLLPGLCLCFQAHPNQQPTRSAFGSENHPRHSLFHGMDMSIFGHAQAERIV